MKKILLAQRERDFLLFVLGSDSELRSDALQGWWKWVRIILIVVERESTSISGVSNPDRLSVMQRKKSDWTISGRIRSVKPSVIIRLKRDQYYAAHEDVQSQFWKRHFTLYRDHTGRHGCSSSGSWPLSCRWGPVTITDCIGLQESANVIFRSIEGVWV